MEEKTGRKSAGGVVWQNRRVLLIRTSTRAGRTVWTLPKGRMEEDEELPDTALREVREETGYLCDLVRPLRETSYQFQVDGVLIDKTVHWFLMRPDARVGTFDRREVDEARWVPFREAVAKLSYHSDQDLLIDTERVLE
jgi:8-oxo-dGTP pyrophosphatase MutT (NUDIX family)